MSAALTQCWTVNETTPLGNVRTSWQLTSDGLDVRSDASTGADSETLRWDAIAEAATAVVELPAHKGGPDMARWMPGRPEWLLISRSDGGRSFMRALPDSSERDAIIQALRERLGGRWVGERLPLQSAQKRLRISTRGDGLRYAAIIASVLALLLLFVMVAGIVGSLLYLPALFAFGAWLFRRGLTGLRDALHIAHTPTAKASSAAMGLVELEGRAVAEQPSPAAVSGRPSVWWDVDVEAWYRERRGKSRWRQVMARHGGNAGLVLEDATGRVPVWLRNADLLLEVHTWESGKDALPPGGVALLEGTGFAWNGGTRLRVHERRMEAGGPLYVLGTLDEARQLSVAGDERGFARLVRRIRTGEWRTAVVRATPMPLRGPVTVVIGYLGLLSAVGSGGGREHRLQDAPPPALAPEAVLVWKGRQGRGFIVSDRRETGALAHLRKRSLGLIGGGVAVLCFGLYEAIQLFSDGGPS
jgi:hypothetical protein